MIRGILKIFAVALSFLFVHLAELSFHSEYYHAASSAAFVASACFSTLFAVITKSRSLLIYASVYVVGSFFYAFMLLNRPEVYVAYDLMYGHKLNYSLLVIIADLIIMGLGGINVIYRFYTLRYHGGSSDNIFDARMGLH